MRAELPARQAPPFSPPARLYVIVDPLDTGRSHLELGEAALRAGARWLQLRAKRMASGELLALARRLATACGQHGALLVVNDRPDVARLAGAGGVHLGQDDLPAAAARAIVGAEAVVGVSTHHLQQVDAAVADGCADYVAYGPVFPTTSKDNPDPVQGLEALRRARTRCPLPLVAIGGIDARRAPEVLAAGADAVAVIGAVTLAADPEMAVRELLKAVAESPQPPRPGH